MMRLVDWNTFNNPNDPVDEANFATILAPSATSRSAATRSGSTSSRCRRPIRHRRRTTIRSANWKSVLDGLYPSTELCVGRVDRRRRRRQHGIRLRHVDGVAARVDRGLARIGDAQDSSRQVPAGVDARRERFLRLFGPFEVGRHGSSDEAARAERGDAAACQRRCASRWQSTCCSSATSTCTTSSDAAFTNLVAAGPAQLQDLARPQRGRQLARQSRPSFICTRKIRGSSGHGRPVRHHVRHRRVLRRYWAWSTSTTRSTCLATTARTRSTATITTGSGAAPAVLAALVGGERSFADRRRFRNSAPGRACGSSRPAARRRSRRAAFSTPTTSCSTRFRRPT